MKESPNNNTYNVSYDPKLCPVLLKSFNFSKRGNYHHPLLCSHHFIIADYLATAPPHPATHYSIAYVEPPRRQAQPAIPAPLASRLSCLPVAAPANSQACRQHTKVSTFNSKVLRSSGHSTVF